MLDRCFITIVVHAIAKLSNFSFLILRICPFFTSPHFYLLKMIMLKCFCGFAMNLMLSPQHQYRRSSYLYVLFFKWGSLLQYLSESYKHTFTSRLNPCGVGRANRAPYAPPSRHKYIPCFIHTHCPNLSSSFIEYLFLEVREDYDSGFITEVRVHDL